MQRHMFLPCHKAQQDCPYAIAMYYNYDTALPAEWSLPQSLRLNGNGDMQTASNFDRGITCAGSSSVKVQVPV